MEVPVVKQTVENVNIDIVETEEEEIEVTKKIETIEKKKEEPPEKNEYKPDKKVLEGDVIKIEEVQKEQLSE